MQSLRIIPVVGIDGYGVEETERAGSQDKLLFKSACKSGKKVGKTQRKQTGHLRPPIKKGQVKERMNAVTIIGIKKAPSKKNPNVMYFTYYYTGVFSDYELENSETIGQSCGSEFSTKDIGCKVGDRVEFLYERGFQDKAQLCGCNVVNPAPVPIGKK